MKYCPEHARLFTEDSLADRSFAETACEACQKVRWDSHESITGHEPIIFAMAGGVRETQGTPSPVGELLECDLEDWQVNDLDDPATDRPYRCEGRFFFEFGEMDYVERSLPDVWYCSQLVGEQEAGDQLAARAVKAFVEDCDGAAWSIVAEALVKAGYSVYDGDQYFAVYSRNEVKA